MRLTILWTAAALSAFVLWARPLRAIDPVPPPCSCCPGAYSVSDSGKNCWCKDKEGDCDGSGLLHPNDHYNFQRYIRQCYCNDQLTCIECEGWQDLSQCCRPAIEAPGCVEIEESCVD